MDRPGDPSRAARPLGARPWAAAAAAALLTALALPLLPRLEVDNSLEAWLPHASASYRQYDDFRRQFGSEEYVLVVYPLDLPMGEERLERLVDLRFELLEIEGVRAVYDLSTIYARFFALLGQERFAADLASPFYRGFLVSEDRRLAATWVLLDLAAAASRQDLVAGIEAAAHRAGFGDELWLAGSPVLNAALDAASTAAARQFYPLVFLVSGAILLLVFRRLAAIVIPALSVGSGLVWTLALLVASGRRLDMVTVALPPVVWVVGLSTSIHLLSRCQSRLRAGEATESAVPATLAELARPCCMSAATTALGFGALTVSAMPPVREMGLFAALGVIACLLSNFLLFPLLGRWWGAGAGRWRRRSEVAARMEALGRRVARRPGAVLAVGGVLAGVALAGMVRLEADANVIEFFAEDTGIARTYREVLPTLTGPYSMEILLEAPDGARNLATLRAVDALARRIESEPGVARVLSVADFVRKAAAPIERLDAAWELPADQAALDEAWARVDEQLAEEVAPLRAGGRLRLSVIARPMGSGEHRRLVERIESLVEDPELAGLAPRVTGMVGLLVELQDELITSQVRSFALAFAIIVPLIGLFFRSARYALLSLPPNLLPILLTLGFMGAAGIRLNPATVMIAAIAFGIVVDDSIHFLSHYREARRSAAPADAVVATLRAVGRPLWITSIVVAAGFSVLCFSSFVPLFDFGLLSAATMLSALAGNLLLLPALLTWRHRLTVPESGA
jgi:predicted RND superfamily exporter protein